MLLLSSCATMNETRTARGELKNEKKLAEQEQVKKAVDSRRFIIKLDRLYFTHGGIVNLRPRNNYLIVDGEKAIISAAYIGKQYDIQPIAGINVKGKTSKYEMASDLEKGKYEIKMEVINGINSFNIHLTIGRNGSCNVFINNVRIDLVRYSGHIVPIKERDMGTPQDNILI